ncbi:hypothetical protein [Streptomyces lincolnensis]|uniref:hypothetical protein n=1 Tax=Streptomyces lincolnensis TaxID=1915 RepID=UPI00083455E3|nr:hypothetical protein [Streptomyces lincolnensis]QMV05404.1 hypothetical protein GJU35_06895 [Streptomyces lincolnensis]
MSSSVVIDWKLLAEQERSACLRHREAFVELRRRARTLERRAAVVGAVTGSRISVPSVTEPGLDADSGNLASALDAASALLARTEERLHAAIAVHSSSARPAARLPAAETAPPPVGPSAAEELARWRERQGARRDPARKPLNSAETEKAYTQAAEVIEVFPDRKDQILELVRTSVAGDTGDALALARVRAEADAAIEERRDGERAASLRERIQLLISRIADSTHGRDYAATLSDRVAAAGLDGPRLQRLYDQSRTLLGELTSWQDRSDLLATMEQAMADVWDFGPDTPMVILTAAGTDDRALATPLPTRTAHPTQAGHAVRLTIEQNSLVHAEVVRLPGGNPAGDTEAQSLLCDRMDEFAARMADHGCPVSWTEGPPAGAVAAEAVQAEVVRTSSEGSVEAKAQAAESARRRRRATELRRRAAAMRSQQRRPTGSS